MKWQCLDNQGGILITLDPLSLIVVCAATAIVGVGVAWVTRRITFYGWNSDNRKQVQTAAAVGQFLRPSAMHNYYMTDNGIRTYLRETLLFSLIIMQRLLRNRDGDYPLVTVCLIANMASALLIFLVASTYWNTEAGLLAWGLYITCILTYQHVLFGTPIILAQMFFLASVYLIQQASAIGSVSMDPWLVGAGAAAAFAFLSSASFRKFVPLLAAAFFYSQRHAIWGPGLSISGNLHASEWIGLGTLAFTGAILLGSTSVRLGYPRLVTAMYHQRTPQWLNRFVDASDTKDLEHYLDKIGELARLGWKASMVIVLYLVIATGLAQSTSFLWSHLSVAIGFTSILLWVTYPNVPMSLWRYYTKLQGWKENRFATTIGPYFAIKGIPLKEGMRGGGFRWIALYYWRVAPVQFVFFAVYLLLGLALLAFADDILEEAWHGAIMLFVSVLTILVAELTKATQFGRSYFPTFIGLLIFIVYVAFRVDESLAAPWRGVFLAGSAAGVLASGVWGLRMFLNDVLPARMGPAALNQTLRSKGIKEFYTYGNLFNSAFVDPMVAANKSYYDVHYVDSLSEVDDGYMVVPGTSTKAANMESAISERVKADYFDADPELNQLIESKEIETYALASYKTFGTSRFWGQEAEITTYEDLILGAITEDDRYRSRAWLIDVTKLRAKEQSH